jgi:hypothetical protein
MALSDLTVFSEYAYAAMTEVQDQQIELFNAATRGGITMGAAAVQGDFSDTAFWKKLQGLVRRRNAYGTGAVSPINLEHLVDTMVKVAAGTPPVEINPSQFTWIQTNPEEAGATIGQQLAGDAMADMLNSGLLVGRVALVNTPSVYKLIAGNLTVAGFVEGAALFGDRAGAIQCWAMHSKQMHDVYRDTVGNTNRLFTFGTINVVQDGFGRVMVMTDSPALVAPLVPAVPADPGPAADAIPAGFYALGLVPGGIVVQRNNDWDDNIETSNGDENIQRTYQAEWTYNLGVKGYSWDKTSGGKSPNDAALASAANWDRYATSIKDLAGVALRTT